MLHSKCTGWQPPTGNDGDEYKCNMQQPVPNTLVLEGLTVTVKKGSNAMNCIFPDTVTVEEKVNTGQVTYCTNYPDNRVIKQHIPEEDWCAPDCIHVKGEPVEVENTDGSITIYYDYYGSLPA